jgi:RNA recognition motif-containing protein
MNIYVGNLSFDVGESELRTAFAAYGEVASARIITDSYSGKSKGFGFVEMAVQEEAEAAIKALNNKDLKGRPLKVNEAKPKTEGGNKRPGGGGGGRSRW